MLQFALFCCRYGGARDLPCVGGKRWYLHDQGRFRFRYWAIEVIVSYTWCWCKSGLGVCLHLLNWVFCLLNWVFCLLNWVFCLLNWVFCLLVISPLHALHRYPSWHYRIHRHSRSDWSTQTVPPWTSNPTHLFWSVWTASGNTEQ